MSKAIYKYMDRNADPVYLEFSDDGILTGMRGADDDLSYTQVIADLVHKLTSMEMSGRVIRNQRAEIDKALAIINDEATKIEMSL